MRSAAASKTRRFPESRLYDQASLDAATRYVEQLDADLGGTELRPALEFVLLQPAKAGLRRCVMLLTDGGVTNTDRVIGLAAAHRATARIFTLGIGSAASQHLVRGCPCRWWRDGVHPPR